MTVKLIATDLDGTLLKNDKTIDPETVNILKDFQKNGGKLVLVTGRRISETRDYINSLDMLNFKSGYVVSCDGQYIWDIGLNRKIQNEFLNFQDILYLTNKLKINDSIVSFYDENNDFILLDNKKILGKSVLYLYHKFIKKNSRIKVIFQSKMIELSNKVNIEKISFKKWNSNIDMQSYYETLLNEVHDYSIILLENRKIEVSKKGVNKCEALKQIMQWINLNNDEVLVFGDEGNDISMLKYFNNSFAMGNACDYVKQSAKFVTDSNESQGVLKAFKKCICECEYTYDIKEESAI